MITIGTLYVHAHVHILDDFSNDTMIIMDILYAHAHVHILDDFSNDTMIIMGILYAHVHVLDDLSNDTMIHDNYGHTLHDLYYILENLNCILITLKHVHGWRYRNN